MGYRYNPNRSEANVWSAYLKALNDVLCMAAMDKNLQMGSGQYSLVTTSARIIGDSESQADMVPTWAGVDGAGE